MKLLHEQLLNETFDTIVRVKKVEAKKTRNGKDFLDVTASDRSGDLKFKVWDSTPTLEENMRSYRFLHIQGYVDLYMEQKQLNVQKFAPLMDEEIKMLDLHNFYEATNINVEEAVTHIETTIAELPKALRDIVSTLYENYKDEFKTKPAAIQQHHAYIGGLIEHTDSMLQNAKFLADRYQPINRNVLYSAVILHDLCKIDEYTDGEQTDTSIVGRLINHINLMAMKIYHIAETKGYMRTDEANDVYGLMHCVLSHHGKPEWGAAVVPMTKEAEILHMIDNLDARMNTIERVLTQAENENKHEREAIVTNKQYTLDNRRMIRLK